MKFRLDKIQTQRQILAPTMQQSIEVLLLPLTELSMAIDKELTENPLLEIDEDKTNSESTRLDNIINNNINRIVDLASTPDESEGRGDSDEQDERPISRTVSLEEYLLQQLNIEGLTPLEYQIGEMIIGNLDDDGYLKISCEEIAEILKIDDISVIENILKRIHQFDPIGVASRDIKECLCTQIRIQLNGHAEGALRIVCECLEELGAKKFQEISHKLKIPTDHVRHLAQLISGLEPKPARQFRPLPHNLYVKADVTIFKNADEELEVLVNNESIPHLRINRYYQDMLQNRNLTPEERTFIKEKVKNAFLFIKSIDQRHQTIKQIATYILNHQKDFFTEGPSMLKPMILKDVAQAIERNESTISRAINNKYMETPLGLYPFKFFFSQGVCENKNGAVASRSIKEDLKVLIEEEDKKNPLSDQEIQKHFEDKGIQLARRTISKYRQMLNILPSHLRKNNN